MNKKLSKEGDALHSIQKSLEKIESLILNIRGKKHSTSSPKIQYVPFWNILRLMGKYILFNFII